MRARRYPARALTWSGHAMGVGPAASGGSHPSLQGLGVGLPSTGARGRRMHLSPHPLSGIGCSLLRCQPLRQRRPVVQIPIAAPSARMTRF